MLNWIRQRFGRLVVGLIIVGIALTFILSDLFSPRAGRGLGGGLGRGGSTAGSVNGEVISVAEFSRELSRRTEALKQMAGGKITDEQLRMFRIRETVFNEMVQRKLILQDCRRVGIGPSDEEVRKKIQELKPFQKEGKFDVLTYRNVLTANQLTTGKFEDMVREDLTVERWMDLIRSRVRVSDDEVQREYRLSNEKRNFKYVFLDFESGLRAVKVSPDQIQEFLKKPDQLARVKSSYEGQKTTKFKDKKFDLVQNEIARDLLARERVDEARKLNQELADKIVPLLGKGSDSTVSNLIKGTGVTVKSTGLVTLSGLAIPGLSDAQGLLREAFSEERQERAKKYESPSGVLVGLVTEVQKADLTKMAGESSKIEQQIRFRKERVLEDESLQELKAKAKIRMDSGVVEDSAGASDVG